MFALSVVLIRRSVTQFIANKRTQNRTPLVGSSHADDTHEPKRKSGGNVLHLGNEDAMNILYLGVRAYTRMNEEFRDDCPSPKTLCFANAYRGRPCQMFTLEN